MTRPLGRRSDLAVHPVWSILERYPPIQQQAFRAWVEGIAPWLWTSVVKIMLDQPVFVVMGVLGILLMLLFRPRKP